jgi:hypothetical protein
MSYFVIVVEQSSNQAAAANSRIAGQLGGIVFGQRPLPSQWSVAAVAELRRYAYNETKEDVPRLLALLKDDSFFVREAAAWPLSDLGITGALPDLLDALHRGFEEGHDNDGLSAALMDMVEANPSSARVALKELLQSGDPNLHEHALWLLEFCKGE